MSSNSAPEQIQSHFHKQAALYESLTGGTTRRIAEIGLKHFPPLTSSTRILDSACGPAVVTKLILEQAASQGLSPPPHITAIDFAQGMIEQVELQKSTHGWTTVDSHVMNAEELTGLESESYDAIFMNFGLFAVPNAVKGAKEMLRVLKPGGVAVITTWKLSSPMILLEDVVGSIRPDSVGRVFPIDKAWLTAEKLNDTLISGGFKPEKVRVKIAETAWESDSKEEFLDVMCGPFWSAIRKDWTEDEKERWRPEMEKRVHTDENGKLSFPMIAWMGIATK
jgi:ubiquinone/menaquinone biosynthesis C-methylase UbiE